MDKLSCVDRTKDLIERAGDKLNKLSLMEGGLLADSDKLDELGKLYHTEGELLAIRDKLDKLSLVGGGILGECHRPGYGTEGVKAVVYTNHISVGVGDVLIHHYHVTITPKVSSKAVCRQIINTLFRKSDLGSRQLAYDGRSNAFAAGALPFASKVFTVKRTEENGPSSRTQEFNVSIKFAKKCHVYNLKQFFTTSFDRQDMLQALNVVLRASLLTKYEIVGKYLVSPIFGDGRLGDGVDFWNGFHQSLRLTQEGLLLNIDTSVHPVYQSIPLVQFVGELLGREPSWPLSVNERAKVKKALKNVMVEVNHTGCVRHFKISDVSADSTTYLTFRDKAGDRRSVVDYFRDKYNIIIRYHFLPAIQVGSSIRPVYFPMEICKIVGGRKYSRKLNEDQLFYFLDATRHHPNHRIASIMKTIAYNDYNHDELVRDFKIQVGHQFTSINARILPPPLLKYDQMLVTPVHGMWDIRGKKLLTGGTIDYWTCVDFSLGRGNEAEVKFCNQLRNMCQSMGMIFKSSPVIPTRRAHYSMIKATLVEVHTESSAKLAQMGNTGKRLQLLIVILPDLKGLYGKVKRICETELGIISQCCKVEKVRSADIQYLENLALKINVKVGGRNTALAREIRNVTDRPTIIFGADVTHPNAGDGFSPPIAAVVASVDWPDLTRYRALVSAQNKGEEIIKDLYKTYHVPEKGFVGGGMIREHLIAFYRATNYKPQRIIFYRDGVGEGQFNTVLREEVMKIREACCSLEDSYRPPITFVIVQKRHHTRLFPANKKTSDVSGNVLPGTVVDTKICHPSGCDFYLCSHAGIQGTSRPTHYHVLYDENRFSADDLQMLTNDLCYTYARCTRSVSVVPPAYYAHLAASRARCYIEDEFCESESTGHVKATMEGITTGVCALPAIKENVKDVMFYC